MNYPARVLVVCLVSSIFPLSAWATMPPPPDGGVLPSALSERKRSTFGTRRGFLDMVTRMQASRFLARNNKFLAPAPLGPQRIEGTKQIPIVTVRFKNTAAEPYPVANLQKELFDGPWSSGTMTDFYKEISYEALTVKGTVTAWKQAGKDDTYYEGADFINQRGELEFCTGTCDDSKLPELFEEAVKAQPANFDWGLYDNNGPDGVPNSGDDDGVVDFVAFVHPESGGECGNRNIWSHRATLSDWTNVITTKSNRNGGGRIVIDDYVAVPALACDGSTMIQIGVFAHEFGHAFGLPDLYDTNRNGAVSPGLANWCLMSGGSWGGDGVSPDRPVHMSPWAKAYLGWVEIKDLDQPGVIELPNYEFTPTVYRLKIDANRFYLVNNIQRGGFDAKLPGAGVGIWEIRQRVIDQYLRFNLVNANAADKGVNLVEADGLGKIDKDPRYRGSPADLFRKCNFDGTTPAKALSRRALCKIPDSSAVASMLGHLDVTKCPVQGVEPIAALDAGVELTPDAAPQDTVAEATLTELQGAPAQYASRLVLLKGTLEFKAGKVTFSQGARSEQVLADLKLVNPLRAIQKKRVEVLGALELDETGSHSLKIYSARVTK